MSWRQCPVCRHPRREEIDRELLAGGQVRAAAGVGRPIAEPGKEYGLAEAAAVLGRSERWLRGHRRALRIGYQLGGRGPWRFTQRELDRVLESARRGRRFLCRPVG